MSQYKNPKWWTKEHDSTWNRVKMAVKRDWDQTKHDVGANEPETNQNVSRTVNQARGKEVIPPRGQPTYAELEPAHRFGYAARSYYGSNYDTWNTELENKLKREWEQIAPERRQTWMQDRAAIRHGWEYDHEDVAEVDTK
jgi:hypothetical protein